MSRYALALVLTAAFFAFAAPGRGQHSTRGPVRVRVPADTLLEITTETRASTGQPIEARPQRILVREAGSKKTTVYFQGEAGQITPGRRLFATATGQLEIEFQEKSPSSGEWVTAEARVITDISDAERHGYAYRSDGVELTLSWGERIRSLAVRIKTSGEEGAGTKNPVWFDVGPVAWQLNLPSHRDFAKGATDTYKLPLPVTAEALTTDDLIYVRLEKKGVFGFTNAPDFRGGGWKPESLSLLVNGRVYGETFTVNQWLRKRRSEWRRLLRPLPPDEQFVRGLRLEINSATGRFGEVIAWVTTKFKNRGISGWNPGPVETATVTGVLKRKPSFGTDGFASLDMELESAEVGGRRFALDGSAGIRHKRYIRIEYKHRDKPVPKLGERVRVSGAVRWDTDKGGFYEIHPRGSNDLEVLKPITEDIPEV
jgi:hypothetical protein